MTFTSNNRFSITAFAIAATAFLVLHGSMLMGFEQLASNGHNSMDTTTSLAKTNTAPRTVTLERVVISTRRV
nr:hypothetical protein [Rhodoferax sp.]